MALTRWSPSSKTLDDFTKEVNSMIDDFFNPSEESSVYRFDPRVDIQEEDDKFKLSAELPGVDKEDIDISIKDDVLSISGEKKEEQEVEESNYHRTERAYGKFQRSFRLHDIVDKENIEAEYDNGVLKIDIPKREETVSEKKQIDIK